MKDFFIYLRVILCFIILSNCVFATDKFPPGYAVASAHPLATNAGLEILAAGGNAFDAAIAVSAALAVVEPYHSGLGGGGFWLLHIEKNKQNVFIDGRETAPFNSKVDMFLNKKGEVVPGLSLNGGLAAAIPGEPAALAYIAEHYGRLPLEKSLAPAIRLAEEGFIVDPQLYYFFTMQDRAEQLSRYPASAAIFLPKGEPIKVGERLLQKDLANTLKILAKEGHKGFYEGPIAKKLVEGVNKAGGIWSEKDLAAYQIKLRKPLEGNYQHMHIITAPLPSAGGIGLLMMLDILSAYPLDTYKKIDWIHYVVEAMRLTYWQRSDLADPDFIPDATKHLLSKENIDFLRAKIPVDRPIDNQILSRPINPQIPSLSNTTHFSILDSEGNFVAATLSLDYIFGSSVVADGTGVLLNDHMDDFSIKINTQNVYGLVGSDKNRIQPGKRPLSSMTPTFIETPNRVGILGTPGGSRIPTMVLLAVLAFNDSYGAISMVSNMRFHHQYLPDEIIFEPNTFSPHLKKALQSMGYRLMEMQQYYGDMQAITWDKNIDLITAASDPRHIGMGAVVNKKNTGGYGIRH